MSTVTRYRDRTLTGLPEQVATAIRAHHTAGTLVSMTAPRPISATDPRVRVTLRISETRPSAGAYAHRLAKTARTRRLRRTVVITTAATTGAAALIAAAAFLIAQLVAFIAAHAALILGVLALVAVAAALLLRTTSNGRRHCSGC